MSDNKARRPFTGRHMAAILVAFFAVVMTVNFTMARFALSTFGGTVVDNSYVASQHYNEWLRRAAAQDRLGWNQRVTIDTDRRIRLAISKDGEPLAGLAVTATLRHPLGQMPPRAIHFAAAGDGTLRSRETLPYGRWQLDLAVRQDAAEARYRIELP